MKNSILLIGLLAILPNMAHAERCEKEAEKAARGAASSLLGRPARLLTCLTQTSDDNSGYGDRQPVFHVVCQLDSSSFHFRVIETSYPCRMSVELKGVYPRRAE